MKAAMNKARQTVHRLRRRLVRVSIFNRLLVGNSLVIIVGAIGGTLLTRQLAVQAELELIVLFSSLGILLSLLVNYAILRTSLRPLRDLRRMVDRVQAGKETDGPLLIRDADPDTELLVSAIQSMRARLEGHARQLRALTERAITAQEDERKRLARNIHDETGQALSSLIISLDRLENGLPQLEEGLRPRLAAARTLATRTLEDLRKLVHGLRPTMLDDLGLVPAIRWYARTNLEEAGIEVRFQSFPDTDRLPPQIETAIFRIAQEAINNVVRHAAAQRVGLDLSRGHDDVILRLEDDGRGFDVDRMSEQAVAQGRLGLLGMRERVELFGGQLMVDSAPGRGTRLVVRVPTTDGGDLPYG
jgi:two-component system sensor histidine kinase UhpB